MAIRPWLSSFSAGVAYSFLSASMTDGVPNFAAALRLATKSVPPTAFGCCVQQRAGPLLPLAHLEIHRPSCRRAGLETGLQTSPQFWKRRAKDRPSSTMKDHFSLLYPFTARVIGDVPADLISVTNPPQGNATGFQIALRPHQVRARVISGVWDQSHQPSSTPCISSSSSSE